MDEIVDKVIRERPAQLRHGPWKFLRRHDGQYMAAYLDYDDQAMDTEDGPAFRICPAEDLQKAVAEIEKLLESQAIDKTF